MASALPLARKVAIVTGGAKRIGAVTAEYLAEDDTYLTLTSRDLGTLHAKAEKLDQKLPRRSTMAIRCNVTDEQQVTSMVDAATRAFGGIDILVNNADGTGPVETPAQDYPAEEFRKILDLNVVGAFLPCKHVIPHMITRGLTRTLALELGPHDITVNAVCPNVTNGGRMGRIVAEKAAKTGQTPHQVHQDLAAKTALGRFVDESDVAAAVRFLVSPAPATSPATTSWSMPMGRLTSPTHTEHAQ